MKSNNGTQFYQQDRIYDAEHISPSVPAQLQGGMYNFAIYDEQNEYIRTDGTVGAFSTDGSSPKHNNRVIEQPESKQGVRIRKLTPKECWRLMDFDDEDFEKAKKVCSDSQLYKQAGNSIVCKCLEFIFRELL